MRKIVINEYMIADHGFRKLQQHHDHHRRTNRKGVCSTISDETNNTHIRWKYKLKYYCKSGNGLGHAAIQELFEHMQTFDWFILGDHMASIRHTEERKVFILSHGAHDDLGNRIV